MIQPSAEDVAARRRITGRLKAGKISPSADGLVVVGRLPGGLYPRTQCEGHLFVANKARKSTFWQSGYVQSATCIVCDEEISDRDASWWIEQADDNDIRKTMDVVKQESQRLREVWGILKGLLTDN